MRNQASQLNAKELRKDIKENTSWHDPYRNSPHIYIGGIPFELNEGDILTVFAQYGRIKKINLMRDKETQKSKGFAFISYENPKSSVLAVDNFDGIELLNRTIKVDHVMDYVEPKSENSIEKLDDDRLNKN